MEFIDVLIVEDEVKLLVHLQETMTREGFSVRIRSTFLNFKDLLESAQYQIRVIILDRLLNGQDSSELIEKINITLPDTKILVLSAINTANEKTALLDRGVDDYLAKPFEMEELVARIKALLRRNSKELSVGNLILDLEKRVARVNGQEVLLQNKEFNLLKTLIRIPGKIYNKKYLYEHVWEVSAEIESNVVEATVNKLRRRLEEAGALLQIKSMRNKGYWIEE